MPRLEYEPYQEESWDAWEEIQERQDKKRGGRSEEDLYTYLPSPREIEVRKKMLRWLQENNFTDRMIFCVMQKSHPDISLVKRLHKKYGTRETERRLKPFMP